MGSSTYVGGSHLTFTKLRLEKGKKLNKYKVFNHNLMQTIGEIHWRGGWRQYTFMALPKIDMSRSCQKEIIKFTDKLMKKWRDSQSIRETNKK